VGSAVDIDETARCRLTDFNKIIINLLVFLLYTGIEFQFD
jgi:hypothetical protein